MLHYLCVVFILGKGDYSPKTRVLDREWQADGPIQKGSSLFLARETLCPLRMWGAGKCPGQVFSHLLVPGPLHCLSSSLLSSWGEGWRALLKLGGQGTQQLGSVLLGHWLPTKMFRPKHKVLQKPAFTKSITSILTIHYLKAAFQAQFPIHIQAFFLFSPRNDKEVLLSLTPLLSYTFLLKLKYYYKWYF